MEFIITEYQHCDLIEINGRIDSYTSPNIDDALKSLFIDGHFNVVVDLRSVTYLSSSGLLVFVHAQKRCKSQNLGEIVISNASQNIYSNFQLAGFNQIFKFYNDVVSAIGSF